MWTQVISNSINNVHALNSNTLSSCYGQAVSEGYKECFKVTTKGLYSTTWNRYYLPDEVKIEKCCNCDCPDDVYRFATMYLLETNDGLKGTLIDFQHDIKEDILKFVSEVKEGTKEMNIQAIASC